MEHLPPEEGQTAPLPLDAAVYPGSRSRSRSRSAAAVAFARAAPA